MLPFLRFTDYMKLMLLAMTVATVSLMNQRQIAVLQQLPVSTQQGAKQVSEEDASRKTVVYQKVCFEATPGFAVPFPDAELSGILPLAFWQPVSVATDSFLASTGTLSGIPAALAGMLAGTILTRAP